MAIPDRVDLIVAGAGNAAMCAALAARERGAEVLVLESASEAERGGNTRYAAGQMRVGFGAAKNLMQVVEGLDAEALASAQIEDLRACRFLRRRGEAHAVPHE